MGVKRLQMDSEECTVCRTKFTRKVAKTVLKPDSNDEFVVVVRDTGSWRCCCWFHPGIICLLFLMVMVTMVFITIFGVMWLELFHKDYKEMETEKRLGLTIAYGLTTFLGMFILIMGCTYCCHWYQTRRIHVI